jgi:hypothetical protein
MKFGGLVQDSTVNEAHIRLVGKYQGDPLKLLVEIVTGSAHPVHLGIGGN